MKTQFKITLFALILIGFSQCKKSNLNNLQDYFVLRNQGADMPVWVEGNANSKSFVIIVHGGPGGDGQIYNTYLKDFSDKMEKEFAMVYWDQRGSGNSGGHFDASKYTTETYVDDLDKLIDVIKLKYGNDSKVFVLGHSWGGTLITAYSIDTKRQNKISGYIAVDGAHDFKNNDVVIKTFQKIGNAEIAAGHFTAEWTEIVNFCNNLNVNNLTDSDIGQLNAYGFTAESYLLSVDSIYNNSGKVNAGKFSFFSAYNMPVAKINEMVTNSNMFAVLKNADYTAQMSSIKIPSLFIWGKFDMVVPLLSGNTGFAACGAADKKLVVMQNSGHSPMINEMENFSNEVINWVKLH